MAKKTETEEPKADYWDALAAFMREHGIVNPHSVEDTTLDALRQAHGL